jgi:hypothetical protein
MVHVETEISYNVNSGNSITNGVNTRHNYVNFSAIPIFTDDFKFTERQTPTASEGGSASFQKGGACGKEESSLLNKTSSKYQNSKQKLKFLKILTGVFGGLILLFCLGCGMYFTFKYNFTDPQYNDDEFPPASQNEATTVFVSSAVPTETQSKGNGVKHPPKVKDVKRPPPKVVLKEEPLLTEKPNLPESKRPPPKVVLKEEPLLTEKPNLPESKRPPSKSVLKEEPFLTEKPNLPESKRPPPKVVLKEEPFLTEKPNLPESKEPTVIISLENQKKCKEINQQCWEVYVKEKDQTIVLKEFPVQPILGNNVNDGCILSKTKCPYTQFKRCFRLNCHTPQYILTHEYKYVLFNTYFALQTGNYHSSWQSDYQLEPQYISCLENVQPVIKSINTWSFLNEAVEPDMYLLLTYVKAIPDSRRINSIFNYHKYYLWPPQRLSSINNHVWLSVQHTIRFQTYNRLGFRGGCIGETMHERLHEFISSVMMKMTKTTTTMNYNNKVVHLFNGASTLAAVIKTISTTPGLEKYLVTYNNSNWLILQDGSHLGAWGDDGATHSSYDHYSEQPILKEYILTTLNDLGFFIVL